MKWSNRSLNWKLRFDSTTWLCHMLWSGVWKTPWIRQAHICFYSVVVKFLAVYWYKSFLRFARKYSRRWFPALRLAWATPIFFLLYDWLDLHVFWLADSLLRCKAKAFYHSSENLCKRRQFRPLSVSVMHLVIWFQLEVVSVLHTRDSHGIILNHSSGWKLVYSGDCVPSYNLINKGNQRNVFSRNSTQWIHHTSQC